MNSYQQVNSDDSIDRVALKGQVIQSSGKVDSCEFITQNAQVRHLLSQADRVAKAPATVLITGEGGTGKEVLAKRLHEHSPRRRAAFIRLNCASLSEGVLESELFGHEKGAFTGAIRQRLGRFEQADRGTLFLDEIGAADLRVQLRLLRVLQEREFERVAGTETLRVDVRVIAATNVDLQEEVRRGNFREDLFYRLNVIQLKLPPLRQRKGDIPLLVEYFIRKLDAGKGGRIRTVDAAALDHLSAYPWPGNVRQLENAVERMVVLAGGAVLQRTDVPEEVLNWRADDAELVVDGEGFREARCSFERHFLCSALHRYHGVISQVAEAVGLSRKSLYAKLEHLEIDYERYRLRS